MRQTGEHGEGDVSPRSVVWLWFGALLACVALTAVIVGAANASSGSGSGLDTYGTLGVVCAALALVLLTMAIVSSIELFVPQPRHTRSRTSATYDYVEPVSLGTKVGIGVVIAMALTLVGLVASAG